MKATDLDQLSKRKELRDWLRFIRSDSHILRELAPRASGVTFWMFRMSRLVKRVRFTS